MGEEPTPVSRPVPPTTTGTETTTPVPPTTFTDGPGELGGPRPTDPTTTDDPTVIRRDIDRTRDDMEGTIDAINDRVNPRRIRERRVNRIRRRWISIRHSIMGSDGYETSSVRDRAPDVGARAADARESVSARVDQARQAVSDAPQDLQRQTRGNPLTAGLIAFGVGALIGSALPESDPERRAARAAAERVDTEAAKERLADHAREVQSGVQDRAREAAEDLKGSARDAAQDVKDDARQQGERVKEEAQQSGQEVRRQA
jgi:hypothetical protein